MVRVIMLTYLIGTNWVIAVINPLNIRKNIVALR